MDDLGMHSEILDQCSHEGAKRFEKILLIFCKRGLHFAPEYEKNCNWPPCQLDRNHNGASPFGAAFGEPVLMESFSIPGERFSVEKYLIASFEKLVVPVGASYFRGKGFKKRDHFPKFFVRCHKDSPTAFSEFDRFFHQEQTGPVWAQGRNGLGNLL